MTPEYKPRILIVDDHEPGRYAMGRTLRQAGFETSEAGTGAEGLRQVAEKRPDLVLLDVRLPDIHGLEVCRRIKASPETSSTLVLQMSATAVDDGSRVAALEQGSDGYIASPMEPAVLIATVRSLLRIRMAEQALQEAVLEWQSTFDAILEGVALLDAGGVVRRSNAALPEVLGLERGKILGQELDGIIPPGDGEPSMSEVFRGLRRTSSERVLGERTLWITVDPIVDSSKNLRGGVAIVTDITGRKAMEQQLQHSQKLESVGLLAGGVAHDFNNLLTGILGNASLALTSLSDDEPIRPILEDVVRAGERAAELTRQLLAYAGKGHFVAGPLDLSRLVQDLVPLIQSSIPRKAQLVLDLESGLPAIQADRTQIEQVVMNLIINAGEAIEGEVGTVTVTTATRRADPGELGFLLSDHRGAADYVSLEVRDTGIGMDEDTQKRIFDPFFSTKFLGRGLGLSAALGIIRGHKGALHVTSAPAKGTLFEVLFPASDAAALPARSREKAALVRGRGAILVIDDEEIVRNLLQQVLTLAGYEVLLAENGAEGLSVFAKNAKRVSLIVLDLVMPVMSGNEVLPHLLTMKPGVPVIVSSGQSEEESMQKLRETPVAGYLQKPYTPTMLITRIQEVLGVSKEPGVSWLQAK
jgi:PAS domain S-box-containing protein